MKTATNEIENLLLQAKDTSMMCPDLYQYYNNLEQRRIVLNDEIDDSLLEMVIMPLLEMDNDGTGKPIELVIQSPGGSVWVGLVLANVIEKMKTPLTITIMGFAMSAGALIAMAHNENVKRRAYPFSVFLIHNGSISIASDKKKVKSLVNFDNEYEKEIRNFILRNTKMTEEFYDEIEDEEFYFGAEKALELGIIDEII